MGKDNKNTMTSEDSRTGPNDQGNPYQKVKIWKTVCFVFVVIGMGLAATIGGPTIPDFRSRLDVTMEQISVAFGIRNIGLPFGSILSGMVSDRYRHFADLVGLLSFALTGIAMISKPHINNLVGLGCMSFLEGFGHGAIDSVGHAAAGWMWLEKSGPAMHVMHLGFPIGATLAPLIAYKFLSEENVTESMTTPVYQSTPPYVNQREEINELKPSRIEIPYGIIGGYVFLACLFLLAIFFYETSKGSYKYTYGVGKSSFKEVFSPQSFRSVGSTKYTVTIMVLTCLYFAFVNGKDSTMSNFIFSYAVESELQFSKQEAGELNAAFQASGILGRIICIILSRWVPVQPVLVIFTIITSTFGACIAFLGTEKKIYIWVFSCLFKLSAAPIWPLAVLWVSQYITFSSIVVGFIQIAANLSSFISQWAAGYLYDTFGPQAQVFYTMACGFMMIITLAAMQIVASCYNKKLKESEKHREKDRTINNLNIFTTDDVDSLSKVDIGYMTHNIIDHETHF